MAAIDYVAVVQQLYVSYFGRPADYYGLKSFTQQLDDLKAPTDFEALNTLVQSDKAGTTALSKLVNSFNASAESAALYGTDNSTIGLSKFVAAIYTNVLGREADVDGLTFWVNEIAAGRLTRANAAMAITDGALNNTTAQGLLDAKTVENKLAVASNFTDALDTVSEINGFAGDKAAGQARDLLAQVTSTTDPEAFQATVDATIAAIVTVNTPGSTFTMSQGLDTVAGTSGNDTINAYAFNSVSGANTTTLNSVDSIDGGAGNDTLFIEVKDDPSSATDFNGVIQGTIKNVETVNIDETAASAGIAIDASKFVGATTITQISKAGAVTNLAATTVAGFKGITAGVSVAAAADTAKVNLDGQLESTTVTLTGSKLANVAITGTVVDGVDAGTSVQNVTAAVTVGVDVQTVTLNTAVGTTLTIDDTGSTKKVTSVDASASTGKVTFVGDADVLTIKGGSGVDTLTLAALTAAASGSTAAVNASIDGGAGNDVITINTSGSGATTVTGGAGSDTVNITGRSTGILTVNLGDGDDTFTSSVAIGATDVIDAGAGADKLLLNLVGSANVGAFSNFDSFDAISLAKTLDVDILATKNTVTEFVTTGDVGAGAVLTNVGAGVGYRVLADTTIANGITLTQKTAGDITLTMDIDETADATTVSTDRDAAVTTNATGVKVVFDADFAGKAASATDNVAAMTVTATAVKTVTVESGGDLATNVLTIGAGAAELTTVTVTGADNLTLNLGGVAAKLATIDASAATGGLVTSLANVIDGGTIKLGSGIDLITATVASTTAGVESISGFEKAAAAAIGTDATAKAAAIADADILAFSGAVADAAGGVFTNGTIAKGVLTFTGAGPATLAAAIAIANVAAETAGETVVFEYLGNSYVFNQVDGNAASVDIVVKLTGVTGITNLVEDTTIVDHFFIV